MLLQSLTIARTTYTESVRQPVVFLIVALSGILQFFNTWNSGFAMGLDETAQVKSDDKLLLDIGMATVFLCGTILAGFVATAVMSREIDNKTVLTIVSKPVSRVAVVLGKFLGVSGAILLAVVAMLVFLLMGIRHGVMSTASDELDGPVLVFSFAAVLLSVGLGAWCNYFYGMNFPQVAVTLMSPLLVVAYLLVLSLSDKWQWQSPAADFKDQVVVACGALGLAILVLTAVATAASTRLGQVMTIVACLGVFLAALLSNYALGRHVFVNTPLGIVGEIVHDDIAKTKLETPGERHTFKIRIPMNDPPKPGDPIFYSPSPSGFPLLNSTGFRGYAGDVTDGGALRSLPTGLMVESATQESISVRVTGPGGAAAVRPPEVNDYVFRQATEVRPVVLALWGALPNLQFFWLLDAVTQNRPVPLTYLAAAAGYALVQVGVFLCVAVMLFQRRDVG